MKAEIDKAKDLLTQTCNGLVVSAGMTAGIFDLLSPDRPVSLQEIERSKSYDLKKLEMWFYFAERFNLVTKIEDSYFLTKEGMIYSKHSPVVDLLGLVKSTQFFMDAVLNAPETFKNGKSLDRLSDGKISRQYQPKVSDNFSLALIDILRESALNPGDSLLDIGCGNASFLRSLSRKIKNLKLTGIDLNLFSIEKGKQENLSMGLSEEINLLVGDITEDLKDFKNQSFDWVSALNVFHFVKPENRFPIIENMMRISKKGIFFSSVIIESQPMSSAANPLMALLWNDFTGFFKQSEYDALNQRLQKQYQHYAIKNMPILMDSSSLCIVARI